MLPESMAPPLANYDEFKAFMAERGITARRDYLPEYEDEETGEIYEGHWTVVIFREEKLSDGRIYVQFIDSGERHVLSGWTAAWEQEAVLLGMALQAGVEDELAG